jgi:hypothetical protein
MARNAVAFGDGGAVAVQSFACAAGDDLNCGGCSFSWLGGQASSNSAGGSGGAVAVRDGYRGSVPAEAAGPVLPGERQKLAGSTCVAQSHAEMRLG